MSKIPKLRFKEFSGEWEEKKFGDIYSFYSTNSFSRDNLNYEQGNIRNIHYGDIHTKFSTLFKLENESVPFINPEVNLAKIKEENYCLVGDLVIADASEDYNDIGKSIEIISLDNEKVLGGLHTFLARPNKHKMALGFVGSLLKSWNIRKQIMTIAQGTKVLSLSSGRLSEVTLNIPLIPEQQKIASFLSTVDTKINQLTRKKELLEQYKKGVMQKIFSQELRFKADDGSEFPEWEEKKFDAFIKEYKMKSTSNDEYTVLTSSNKGLMLQSDYFGENRIVDRENVGFNVIPEGYITYRSRSDNRTFTFNINNIGFTGIISTYYPVFEFQQGNNKFFVKLANYYQHIFGKYSVGTSQTVLSLNEIKNIKMKLPNQKEQTKIVNFLSAIDSKIDLVVQQLDEAKNFKKGLLQQMFVR